MPAPILADLKAHLNINPNITTDDLELQSMLDAAVDVVESIVGPIDATPVTETHYGFFGPVLVLRQAPVAGVQAVTYRSSPGAPSASFDVDTDIVVDEYVGAIRLAAGWPFCGDITVSYDAGRADVPPAVALATLIVAAQLWGTQRGAMPLPANTTDETSGIDVGFAPAIPSRAKTLLAPFARSPLVA